MFLRSVYISVQAIILLCRLLLFKLKLTTPSGFGKMLATRFKKAGGIYVKLGQLLAVRPDIISFEIAKELYPLLQNLPPVEFTNIRESICKNINQNTMLAFSNIDTTPIGTGSIAQVHKAIMTDGRQVVIKVLKPSIKKHLETDLKILRRFMKIGSHMPGLKKFPINQLAIEIDGLMRKQLNLLEEAHNLKRFKKNFLHNPSIIIPHLYESFSSPEIIVMEYIALPDQTDFNTWPVSKRTEVAQNALKMLYQMMFKDGFTHCDLHPGNFFVTNEGQFILLDFGMANAMTEGFKENFLKFFYYLSINSGRNCAEIIEETALFKSKNFDRDKLIYEVVMFINKFSRLPAYQFSVLSFTKKLIEIERKCGIKGATEFINNILAITFFESFLKALDPNIDFQEQATAYVLEHIPTFADFIIEL